MIFFPVVPVFPEEFFDADDLLSCCSLSEALLAVDLFPVLADGGLDSD